MNMLNRYRKFQTIERIGAIISGIGVFVLMLFIVGDVLLRNVVGISIPGNFEIVQNYLLPVIVFPALAWVSASGVMPNMDLLLPRLSDSTRNRTVMVIVGVEIVVIAIVLVATTGFAIWNLVAGSSFLAGISLLPQWPAQLLVPVGFLLLLIELCFVFAVNLQRDRAEFTVDVAEGAVEGEPSGL